MTNIITSASVTDTNNPIIDTLGGGVLHSLLKIYKAKSLQQDMIYNLKIIDLIKNNSCVFTIYYLNEISFLYKRNVIDLRKMGVNPYNHVLLKYRGFEHLEFESKEPLKENKKDFLKIKKV